MSAPTRDDPAAAIGSTRLTNVDADLVLTHPPVSPAIAGLIPIQLWRTALSAGLSPGPSSGAIPATWCEPDNLAWRLPEAVALPEDVQHMAVVEQSVQDGRGDDTVPQQLTPLAEPVLEVRIMEPLSYLADTRVKNAVAAPCRRARCPTHPR